MIRIFQKDGAGAVRPAADCDIALGQSGLVWIDLEKPTESEERNVERALGVNVLTAAERMAFEDSARFYMENGALYLTISLMGRRTEGAYRTDPVTFILTSAGTLVTVRQLSPRAFDIGEGRSSARIANVANGGEMFVALLEGCVERIADILMENTGAAHELSREIFADERKCPPNLRAALYRIGQLGTLSAICHESLSSLARAMAYVINVDKCAHGAHPDALLALRVDIDHLERDVQAFKDHLTYLQEAMLGIVGADQNNTLKTLSLATIAFAPPTLIASIFGMNLKSIGWFDERLGSVVAFALMIAAPVALFFIARWRRWF